MGRKANKTGRNSDEHYTVMVRNMMVCPAWQALTTTAQALYVWLRLEWKGERYNNNGKIRLSVRQAAERLGIGINAAARGFQDLQAKGFITVTERACLGISGMARSPSYELTELAMPASEKPEGRKLYRDWRQGHDFPVEKHSANNPRGSNGKNETLSSKRGRTCLQNGDVQPIPVIKMRTGRHQNGDVQPVSGSPFVTKMKTSLLTRYPGPAPDLSVMAGLDLCPLLPTMRDSDDC
jgi:hypothetical protein